MRRDTLILSALALALPGATTITTTPHGPVVLGDPGAWITPNDYPEAALNANTSGDVRVRLDIDDQGTAKGCTITMSSTSPVLDQTTCSLLLQRTHFSPALDDHGKPTASTWSGTLRWRTGPFDSSDPDCKATSEAGATPARCANVEPPNDPAARLPVTVMRKNGAIVCTVEMDGKNRDVEDSACAAIARPLLEQGLDLPVTIPVSWAGHFSVKPAT